MLTHTEIVVGDLHKYLEHTKYYDSLQNDIEINKIILEKWQSVLTNALTKDIEHAFPNIIIEITLSEFDIISEDDRGECVFYCRATLTSKVSGEQLLIVIKTLVYRTIILVYLRSNYANVLEWPGSCATLKHLFVRLKFADRNAGYFSPISWQQFVR
jgi:hypothetical protein